MAQEKLAKNAKEFTNQLIAFASAVNKDTEQVIRWSVLKLFANIVKRSPVDTGTYRASHCIASGMVSSEGGVEAGFTGGASAATQVAMNKSLAWRWHLGDGSITIFNNAPYAEVIEFGGFKGSGPKISGGFSIQAPQGVYALSMAEFNEIFAAQVKKAEML